ncbi:MAG: PfkB family carbohydrate kinase [Desulfurococcaceae archaeon]|nr:PfkB family carbohydrate kinase [Desulfurococcaceae archaeon]
MKILIVGNVTVDEVGDRVRVGGTGYYGGRALAEYLGEEVYVATHIDEGLRGLIRGVLETCGVRVIELSNSATPVFVIEGGKAVGFKGKSPRISLASLEPYANIYKFDVVILGPILQEVNLEELSIALSWSPKILSLDIQGVVREVEGTALRLRWRTGLEEAFKHLDVVHGNVREFCFSKDSNQVLRAVREWSSTGKTLFLVSLDEKGLYTVYRGEVFYTKPVHVKAVDEVGAGDILLATTSYYMAKGADPLTSALKGVAAAVLKVENAYRDWFTVEMIEQISRELMAQTEAVTL